jgi:hypothetical protein
MNLLASNSWQLSRRVLYIADLAGALELGTLILKPLSHVFVITVTEFSPLSTNHVMCILLGENLLVLNRLNRGVVVVLVNLTINRPSDIFLLCSDDPLVLDIWAHCLMDDSLMLSISWEEVRNCCFRLSYDILVGELCVVYAGGETMGYTLLRR